MQGAVDKGSGCQLLTHRGFGSCCVLRNLKLDLRRCMLKEVLVTKRVLLIFLLIMV